MINPRITNSVANTRAVSQSPNVRKASLDINGKIQNVIPNIRNSRASASTASSSGGIQIGMPIGLLLALTYATASGGTTTSGSSDYKPNVRITTK